MRVWFWKLRVLRFALLADLCRMAGAVAWQENAVIRMQDELVLAKRALER